MAETIEQTVLDLKPAKFSIEVAGDETCESQRVRSVQLRVLQALTQRRAGVEISSSNRTFSYAYYYSTLRREKQAISQGDD